MKCKFCGIYEGKYVDELIVGFGIKKDPFGRVFILSKEENVWYEVNFDSIKQFTGHYDKSGKEIYKKIV